MRPCDCFDGHSMKNLKEHGIGVGNVALELDPVIVKLTVGPCTVKLSQHHFKQIAEWYLEDQNGL